MKKNHFITSEKAFTLIETLLYVAIFSMMIIGLATFASSLNVTRLQSQSILEVNNQGSKVLRIITQTLRNAQQVNSPLRTQTAQNLSLVTNDPAKNPTVFSLDNGIVYITEGASAPVALTDDAVTISDLSFTNTSLEDTSGSIQASFIVTNTNPGPRNGGTYTVSFQGSASLRK